MEELIVVAIIAAALGAVLFAKAQRISARLVQASARRLPRILAARMEEEWLGELNEIASRPGKLAFAAALILTPRRAYAGYEEESMKEVHDRPAGGFALLRDWKSILILPTLFFAVTAYAASYLVPVKYESKAVMLIHPQESPIEFVHNNSEEQVEDQVEILTRMVLTRDNLVRLLRSLEIEKKEKTLDQQVKALNEAISTHFSPMTKNPKMGGSFELRYIGSNPVTVRKVTSALVDLMLSRSRKYREERLMGSSEFLSTQLRELREQLIETDKKRNRQEISGSASEKRMLDLDYDLLESGYKSMFAKSEEMNVLMNLERRQQSGRQLVLVESPTMGVPVSPNRINFAVVGAFFGMAFGGMALAGLHRKQRRAALA